MSHKNSLAHYQTIHRQGIFFPDDENAPLSNSHQAETLTFLKV